MCILFIALKMHPRYPLVLCANRDEFHHRPTAPAHFWPPEHRLLAGRDLQAGGTWLGVNRDGDIAALTNIRAPTQQDGMRSRGELVTQALTQPSLMTDAWLQAHSQDYNPFNLVFGRNGQLQCFNSQSGQLQALSPGFHAISNGALDDIWPKMAKGQQALERLISSRDELNLDTMLALMQDETRARDEELPSTGIDLEWERRLSAIYIKHPDYGTRSTSLVLQDVQGRMDFTEVRYDGKGRKLGREHFQLAPQP
ncbi:NRDE family protein [Shewanella salipaludis]|uniref:NRDE family protein n=1 Tax=Shewanella salipaludis TaxID=2723052 RepID=A0A972JM77_9GAMM|nr:NRDE family protein [Shewanella salipaludis]NMH66217.1 NRDE family protein [Shewanella salipaludis]